MSKEVKAAIISSIITGFCTLLVGVIGTLKATESARTEININLSEYQSMYNELSSNYKKIEEEYSTLAQENIELEQSSVQYDEIAIKYERLLNDYSYLENEYVLLKNSIEPSKIKDDQVIATYKYINFSINGNYVSLMDEDRQQQQFLIADETIYVPVLAISKAFGKKSIYEASSNTIKIDDKSPTNNDGFSTVKLTSLNHLSADKKSFHVPNKGQANSETFFNDALEADIYTGYGDGQAYREYLLNKQYSYMEGNFYLSFDTRDTHDRFKLKIWGDDLLLYESDTMKAGALPILFNVNLDDVNIMKIGIESETTLPAASPTLGLGNVILYKYK